MLKTKEDDFLGDKITNNIKVAENEWQAAGSVDRSSVYSKESILNAIFEGYDYRRDRGDYKDYIPRASVANYLSSTSNSTTYSGAKAQHDLLMLDNRYYLATSLTCVTNIFSTTDYFNKAVGFANPVYSDKAAVKTIHLIDPDILGTNKSIKVIDLCHLMDPRRFADKSLDTDSDYYRIVEKYAFEETSDGELSFVSAPFKKSSVTSFDTTTHTKTEDALLYMYLYEFLNCIKEIPFRDTSTGLTQYDMFMEDFSLKSHDSDSILMPFNKRGYSGVGQDGLSDEDSVSSTDAASNDIRTYMTRFAINSVTKAVANSSTAKLFNIDTLNELVEESLFAEGLTTTFSTDTRTIPSEITTNTSLAEEVLTTDAADKKYLGLIDPTDSTTITSLQTFEGLLDTFSSSVSSYATPVVLGVSGVAPQSSWNIHYCDAEDISNLLITSSDSYSLYTRYVLGYKLVDALIATRTFVGGIYNLICAKTLQDTDMAFTPSLPLSCRSQDYNLDSFGLSDTEGAFDFYPSVSIINSVYKLGHTTNATYDEIVSAETEKQTDHIYNLADVVKEWLRNEVFLFKAPVFGDFVEELNFMQDLTPDSDVTFSNARIKKTDLVYKRLQDSKYEIPYLQQTTSLINLTDNEKGLGVHASDSFAAKGNLKGTDASKSRFTIPPQFYDYDKGDQESDLAGADSRATTSAGQQQVLAKRGQFVVEDRIISPTIDEINTVLKLLIESDGAGTDQNINERLPSFYGIKKSALGSTFTDNDIVITSNPLADENTAVVDILGWKPVQDTEYRLHYSSSKSYPTYNEHEYGGYTVKNYIEKVYDYKVYPFTRRSSTSLLDGTKYEFNTEVSNNHNRVYGYLEKLYNNAILIFDAPDIGSTTANGVTQQNVIQPTSVNTDVLSADPLIELTGGVTGVNLFTETNDGKLLTKNIPAQATVQRQAAFNALSRILTWTNASGEDDKTNKTETSMHNHYKKYLEFPKNLKEIERDLETIRQNLQMLSEYVVATTANLGYADRGKNRGTLMQLHRNAYKYLSTWLVAVNNTVALSGDTSYNYTVDPGALTDTLNNTTDSLVVTDLDKKVVFDDGDYDHRYQIENYDKFVIDLNSDPTTNTRARHKMYRPNETLLSEVYLAADGTWRSVHEHICAPTLYSDM